MNTQINYLYRDADNYKKRHAVIIEGEMTEDQEKAIEECLDEGAYFIPAQVGLPNERFDDETEADHPWFEWEGYEASAAAPTLHITTAELVARFVKAANGWEASVDASTDGPRPFCVTVRETLSRLVVIWAEDKCEAEEKANELCNASVIYLEDTDFIDRECECNGVAQAYDMSTFKQYGAPKTKSWSDMLADAAATYAKMIGEGRRTMDHVPRVLVDRVQAVLIGEEEKEDGGKSD